MIKSKIEVSQEMKELLENNNNEEEVLIEDNNIDNNYSTLVMQILGVAEQIQIIDDYLEDLPNQQSKIDEEISDLLHYIENNDLTPKQSTKMIKLLKEKRTIRRGLNNDYEIKKLYNSIKSKLLIDNQRQFFLTDIHKKAKELNSTYKNRQLDCQEIEKLIK